MPESRPPYSPEYRQQIVDLVRGGRTPEELSRGFEPSDPVAERCVPVWTAFVYLAAFRVPKRVSQYLEVPGKSGGLVGEEGDTTALGAGSELRDFAGF